MTALYRLSAAQLADGYARRDFTPVEALRSVVDRVLSLNDRLNCVCHFDPEAAMRDATAATARWAAGMPLSPLDGVPTTVKDLLLAKGWPTLFGSLATNPNQPWDTDAPAVESLRRAGVVIFGKTTTPEWGHKGSTESRLHGITRNPWNTDLTPGGSSGGAGAALASGMGPLAVGSDGGGSCRTPANFCGVVGMKPTHGRVPLWPPSTWGHLTTPGPMTRTVEDAANMLTIMTRPGVRDPLTRPDNPFDAASRLKDGIKGLRVAFSPGFGMPVKKVVRDVVTNSVRTLEDLGAIVEEIDPPVGDVVDLFRSFFFVGAAITLHSIPKEKHELLEDLFRQVAGIGEKMSATDYVLAVRATTELRQRLSQFHRSYDLIVTATNSVLPFPVGAPMPPDDEEGRWDNFSPALFPVNLSGQPGISVPCGHSAEGLPIGLHMVAAAGRDDLVLRAAYAYEQAAGFPHQLAPI